MTIEHDFDNIELMETIQASLSHFLRKNFGKFLRCMALPKSMKQWSLRVLRDKLVKIGDKVISHSRYVISQVAEVAVSRARFKKF